MGSELQDPNEKRFDLADLGLLDGPAERDFDVATRLATHGLKATSAVFFMSDVRTSSIFIRSRSAGQIRDPLPDRFSSNDSLFAAMIDRMKTLRIDDITAHPEFSGSPEVLEGRLSSALIAPVFGPARETVGGLAVFGSKPRKWTELDVIELKDYALILTRLIMLRASLETLKRLSAEREVLSRVTRFRN